MDMIRAFFFLLLPFFGLSVQAQEWGDTIPAVSFDFEMYDLDDPSIDTANANTLVHPQTGVTYYLKPQTIAWEAKGRWMSISPDQYGDLPFYEIFSVESAAFIDLNNDGSLELLTRMPGMSNGSRGGSSYSYIQIWDLNAPVLIIEFSVFEAFEWFGKTEGSYECSREVTIDDGLLHLHPIECDNWLDGQDAYVDFNKEKLPYLFKWDGSKLINTLPNDSK